MASSDLQWQIIRKNSCFLHRQRGINKLFSREPMNLKGINSQRYNGLVNEKAVGVAAAPDGKGVVLTRKRKDMQNKPRDSVARLALTKDSRRTMQSIHYIMFRGDYRPELTTLAQRRACQILRSQRKGAPKRKRRGGPAKKKTD